MTEAEILSLALQALPELEKLIAAEVKSGKAAAEIMLALETLKLWLTSKTADLATLVKTADAVADAAEIVKFGGQP